MNILKKKGIIFVCCLGVLFCVDNGDVYANKKSASKIVEQSNSDFRVKNKNINLHIEDKSKIKLSFKNYKKHKIRFRSMNKKIATVNRKGIVTGKRTGKTIIKIYDRKKRIRKCKVNVTQGYTLSFPKTSVELIVGQSIENQAVMSNYMNETIFYESSNSSVAEVDDEGNITAKGVGQAVITAEGVQAKAQCIVSVVDNIYSDMATFTAHRGYCEEKYKENTMEAFMNAVRYGFKGIETDIRVTADGEFVLSHDDSLWKRVYTCPNNLTDSKERKGNISQLTYDQIYQLTGGEIVKLSDYLDYIKDKNVHSYLEIKELVAYNYPTTEMAADEEGKDLLQKQQAYQVRRLLALIYNRGMANQVTISSFENSYLELVRKDDGTIAIQYTISTRAVDFDYLKNTILE